jgi:hypothetical protein
MAQQATIVARTIIKYYIDDNSYLDLRPLTNQLDRRLDYDQPVCNSSETKRTRAKDAIWLLQNVCSVNEPERTLGSLPNTLVLFP